MKLPIEWLREFVEVKESPKELAEIFTMLGAEVGAVYGDVLDLEVTPNRPDWLSVYGLARELAAFKNRPLKKLSTGDLVYQKQSKMLDLHFENEDLIPRYAAIIFDNINIKPSSKLIQQRLKQMGINNHNNIIDITNYVMVELGLPLHAFDLDEITGHKMTLRESKQGEKLETLDEKIYTLPDGSLVIEDAKRLIDLMGIKGGANSGIKSNTKRILLQATVEDSRRIRMTSKKIGLSTEASYRFERGIDPESIIFALERAKRLILDSCNATILESVDIVNQPTKQRKIMLDPARISKLLGTKIEEKIIKSSLNNLGFDIRDWQITVPSWRLSDVYFGEDLIEEVARMYGYDKLDRKLIQKPKLKNKNKEYNKSIELRNYLTSLDFNEVLTYSLLSKKEAGEKGIELEKALSPETAYLRTSLIPGLIKTISQNPWASEVNIFEIGRVFNGNIETEMIGIASTKKLLFDIESQIITPDNPLAKFSKLRRTVYVAEMTYSQILKNLRIESKQFINQSNYSTVKYREISQFPPAVRDIAIVVNANASANELINSIKSIDNRILLVEMFDEFKSDKFGIDKKSLAFHLVFDDPKQTMTENEVNKLMDQIIKMLENNFAAKLR